MIYIKTLDGEEFKAEKITHQPSIGGNLFPGIKFKDADMDIVYIPYTAIRTIMDIDEDFYK